MQQVLCRRRDALDAERVEYFRAVADYAEMVAGADCVSRRRSDYALAFELAQLVPTLSGTTPVLTVPELHDLGAPGKRRTALCPCAARARAGAHCSRGRDPVRRKYHDEEIAHSGSSRPLRRQFSDLKRSTWSSTRFRRRDARPFEGRPRGIRAQPVAADHEARARRRERRPATRLRKGRAARLVVVTAVAQGFTRLERPLSRKTLGARRPRFRALAARRRGGGRCRGIPVRLRHPFNSGSAS